MRTASIYLLLCPFTHRARYVGKTVMPVTRRLAVHLSYARKGDKSRRSKWLRSLLRCGAVPDIVILASCPDAEADDMEVHWIATLTSRGHPVVNGTTGGDGARGYLHTDEVKAAMSRLHRGRPKSDAHRAALSAALKGKPPSAAHVEATRKRVLPPIPPEQRAKMVAARRGVRPVWSEAAKAAASVRALAMWERKRASAS